MTENNDYDDHSGLLPITVYEVTASHWTDRVSACLLEQNNKWALTIRFDKLPRPQVEVTMCKIFALAKTTVYDVKFNQKHRTAVVNYKDDLGHAWFALENVESVYNDRR